MNDQPLSDASAYLDDELTAAERSAVEHDPAAMAAVERFAELRRSIADVEPPSATTREAVLAAALDAFDTSGTAAPEPDAASGRPASMPEPRRLRFTAWLAPAAAVVAVVAIGALVVSTSGSDDDEASDTATVLDAGSEAERTGDDGEADAQLDEPASALIESMDTGSADDADDGAAEGADESTGGDTAADEAPADGDEAAPDGGAAPEANELAPAPAPVPIDDVDQLASFASEALARIDDGGEPAPTDCPVEGTPVGEVLYDDVVAVVVVDPDRTTARAVDAATCDELTDTVVELAN